MAFLKKPSGKAKKKLPPIPQLEEEEEEEDFEEDFEEEEEEEEELPKKKPKPKPKQSDSETEKSPNLSKQEIGDLVETSFTRTMELFRYYRGL
ncbi:hypothetical protein KY314_04615 [Candidatus Woesearchaeota archaeon]|nr:hypothetical protein [Candidatus Woesearchaeota archaeon]